MKSTRGLLIALAAACALGTSAGCYTMLKHPRLKIDDKASYAGENEYGYDSEAISFADDCASCHSPGSLQIHHPAVPPPRRFVSPIWDDYYDYPWWIPYYASGNTNGNAGTVEEQKKRPFDRRHQSRPEEPVAAPSSASTPSSPTPAPVSVAKPADSGTASSTPQKTEDTNKREERNSEKKQSGERRTRKP